MSLRFRDRIRSSGSGALPLAILVAAASGATACLPPVPISPLDAASPATENVTVTFGVGVSLQEVDGTRVEAPKVLLTPEVHELHFYVRRSLRKVDDLMAGVYNVGVCDVAIQGEPGEEVEIRTQFATEVNLFKTGDPMLSSTKNWNMGVYAINHAAQTAEQLDCPLRMDCRSLDTRRMSPSASCTYAPFPPE